MTSGDSSFDMADRVSSSQRHLMMSHIGSRDTRPELKVRRALHYSGYRYRLNVRTLHGAPDIVLPKYRTAIFVNGCFWHGHKGCKQYTVPQTSTEFWVEKVRRNKERDELAVQRLESLSWYNGPQILDTELRQTKTLRFVVEYGKDITQEVHA